MSNQEQLDLIYQGKAFWNKWRGNNPEKRIDLSRADLRGTDLRKANFIGANLIGANLSGADLVKADLIGADLFEADLSWANLSGADLSGANLNGANLFEANLSRADLIGADLSRASLIGADLKKANLGEANVGWTTFGNVDLSVAEGLDKVKHFGPSIIGIDTIYKSKGDIPKIFLREAGVPENFIEYMAALARKPIEFYSCFISYSTIDKKFAERLYTDLQSKHVRCWYAPEHMKIGDKIRQTIDQTIRVYDKLLLVLSEHSIASNWVEKEVETAFEEERRREKTVLFPIRLDWTVMDTDEAWASDIRRTRHIGNFVQWKKHDEYKEAFDRLLRDLKAVT